MLLAITFLKTNQKPANPYFETRYPERYNLIKITGLQEFKSAKGG